MGYYHPLYNVTSIMRVIWRSVMQNWFVGSVQNGSGANPRHNLPALSIWSSEGREVNGTTPEYKEFLDRHTNYKSTIE